MLGGTEEKKNRNFMKRRQKEIESVTCHDGLATDGAETSLTVKRRRLARSLDDDESLLGNPENENNLTMTVNSADVSSSASSPFKDFNITQRYRVVQAFFLADFYVG